MKISDIKTEPSIIGSIEDCNFHRRCINCGFEYYDNIRDHRTAMALSNPNLECPGCGRKMGVKENKETQLKLM